MIFFGKKDDEQSEQQKKIREIIDKRNEIKKDTNTYEGLERPDFHSMDYERFKKESEKQNRKSWYEVLCNFSEKLINATPDKDTEEELEGHIQFTGLKVTPTGVMSLSILSLIVLILIDVFVVLALKILIDIPTLFILLIISSGPLIAYYLYKYPSFKANIMRMTMGRDLVLAILYIIVYMKSTSNLEGAVRYAAENVSGKLSRDLKNLLWNVEIGKYTSVQEALTEYTSLWKDYNKEFVEAIQLVMESMIDPSPERRGMLLDKAIDIVLEETEERMKAYTRSLETPIEVIHGLGILLPVMGMVVFPLITIFLKDSITYLDYYLIIGYNVFLPSIIYVIIYNILQKRPPTYSSVDLSSQEGLRDAIIVKFNNKIYYINPYYISGTIGVLGLSFLIYLWRNYKIIYDVENSAKLILSLAIVYFVAIVLSLHFYISSFQKTRVRKKLVDIESEFGEALFALGNRLHSGLPLESALQAAYNDVKKLSISELFGATINNMMRLNMTFKQALLDPEYGSLKRYPSKLIRTIMTVLASSISRGTRATAISMITISRYLRGLKSTQEKINDLLGSSLSSMKFNSYVLVPVISGIIVGISKLVLTLLSKISGVFEDIQNSVEGVDSAQIGSLNPGSMLGFQDAIPTYTIQLIVGIYVIEMLIILAIFMTRVETGNDKIKERENIWKLLMVGLTIYVLVFLITMMLFNPLISGIASSFS